MSGNYTGPYWSDGKFQESVVFGKAQPSGSLDALSRLHDTAYGVYKDERHREAADWIYASDAAGIPGGDAAAAAFAVKYGNSVARKALNLATVAPLGALGVGSFVYGEISDAIAKSKGTYLKKEIQEIRDLYKKDPQLVTAEASSKLDPYRFNGKTAGKTRETPQITPRPTPQPKPTPPPPGVKVVVEEKQQSIRSPQRTSPEYSDPTQYTMLPNGRFFKRRRAKKRVAPILEPLKPDHRLADLVEPVVYREKAKLPPGAVYVKNGFDPTWNVNYLKMKRNKVKPRP